MRHYKRNSRKACEFRRGLFTALLGFLSDDRLKKAAPVDHSTDLRLSLTIVILINQDIISIHSEAGYAGERHFAAVPNVPEPTQRHAWPCCQASPGIFSHDKLYRYRPLQAQLTCSTRVAQLRFDAALDLG